MHHTGLSSALSLYLAALKLIFTDQFFLISGQTLEPDYWSRVLPSTLHFTGIKRFTDHYGNVNQNRWTSAFSSWLHFSQTSFRPSMKGQVLIISIQRTFLKLWNVLFVLEKIHLWHF